MKNGTLTYKVGELKKDVVKLDTKMEAIMENHLPHIEKELASLKTRIEVLTAVNIGAIILATIINKFL